VEKPPHLNWATQFMMVYVPLMFLSEWHEFPSALCLAGGKKLDDNSRLDVVEMACEARHVSFQRVTRKDNSAHEQIPLSSGTIDSIL
jgi:hypothetical protein